MHIAEQHSEAIPEFEFYGYPRATTRFTKRGSKTKYKYGFYILIIAPAAIATTRQQGLYKRQFRPALKTHKSYLCLQSRWTVILKFANQYQLLQSTKPNHAFLP